MIDRAKIHSKYGGRCAYCGQKITIKQMQVDHFWPQFLSHFEPGKDKDRLENLMPSCQKCNNFKGGMRPKEFREQLSLQVTRLKKNAQFDRAFRFDQISITESPIIFYFEKQSQ